MLDLTTTYDVKPAQIIPTVCADCRHLCDPNDWETPSWAMEGLYCRKGRFLPTKKNRCNLKQASGKPVPAKD